jgi:hypothetical protein
VASERAQTEVTGGITKREFCPEQLCSRKILFDSTDAEISSLYLKGEEHQRASMNAHRLCLVAAPESGSGLVGVAVACRHRRACRGPASEKKSYCRLGSRRCSKRRVRARPRRLSNVMPVTACKYEHAHASCLILRGGGT